MGMYNKFLKRVDLVQNQVAREKLAEEKEAKLKKKRIQQQNAQRFAEYQQILRAELEARIFANVSSTGGDTSFSFGNALKFDGVNDYVSISGVPIGSSQTISLWVKPTLDGIARGVIADSASSSAFLCRSTDVIFRLNGFNQVYTALNNAIWNHVFVRLFGTTCEFYINGTLQNTKTVNFSGISWNLLGQNQVLAGSLNGLLDEVAIWNTDIGNQSANLYNGGSGDFATNYSGANLIAYWKMNGSGADTTAIDEKGNYNGTLTNFSRPPEYWVAH